MTFELHPNFSKKIFLFNLPLCIVLQEDEKHYPWFILVPRIPNTSRLIDLSEKDQMQLYREMDFIQRKVWEEAKPTQLNVAAIGNKTPQLHVHIIARFDYDPAWPNTVWDHPIRSKYNEEEKYSVSEHWQAIFSQSEAFIVDDTSDGNYPFF